MRNFVYRLGHSYNDGGHHLLVRYISKIAIIVPEFSDIENKKYKNGNILPHKNL